MNKNSTMLVLLTLMMLFFPRILKAQEQDNPKNADIALTLSTPDKSVTLIVKGPQTIDVDFGDGEKETFDLAETDGVVSGYVSGSNMYIYSKDITYLDAQENYLSSMYVYNGANIKNLNVDNNKFTELTLKNMPNLEVLSAVKNKLTKIDIESCPNLNFLSVSQNYHIEELNLSNNPKLKKLYVGSNLLSSLDLSNLPQLEVLSFGGNENLTSIDISKLSMLKVISGVNSNISELNIENNPLISNINMSGSSNFSSLIAKDLKNVVRVIIYNCNLNKSSLDQIITSLPDVSSMEVLPNERSSKRQFEFDGNPGTKEANVMEAKNKGWYTDVLEESWSIGPKDPCLVFTTGLDEGKEIIFTVENFFDPFWIFWGNFWGSFYQPEKFELIHDVVTPEIGYYSRGLMTFECRNMNLQKLDFTGNDQTYSIDVRDNSISEIILDPSNVFVSMNLRNNNLSSEGLNKIFNSLNNISELVNPFYFDFKELKNYGVINIEGNPGCKDCDVTIAENKGYTVEKGTDSGIDTINDITAKIYIDEVGNVRSNIVIDGISVYSMDGAKIFSSEDNSDVYNANLLNGIYLVTYKTIGNAGYKKVKVIKF